MRFRDQIGRGLCTTMGVLSTAALLTLASCAHRRANPEAPSQLGSEVNFESVVWVSPTSTAEQLHSQVPADPDGRFRLVIERGVPKASIGVGVVSALRNRVGAVVLVDFNADAQVTEAMRHACENGVLSDIRIEDGNHFDEVMSALTPGCMSRLDVLSVTGVSLRTDHVLRLVGVWETDAPRVFEARGTIDANKVARRLSRGPTPELVLLQPAPSSRLVRRLLAMGVTVAQ